MSELEGTPGPEVSESKKRVERPKGSKNKKKFDIKIKLDNINQQIPTLNNSTSAAKDLPTVEKMHVTKIDKKGYDANTSDCDQTDVIMK